MQVLGIKLMSRCFRSHVSFVHRKLPALAFHFHLIHSPRKLEQFHWELLFFRLQTETYSGSWGSKPKFTINHTSPYRSSYLLICKFIKKINATYHFHRKWAKNKLPPWLGNKNILAALWHRSIRLHLEFCQLDLIICGDVPSHLYPGCLLWAFKCLQFTWSVVWLCLCSMGYCGSALT